MKHSSLLPFTGRKRRNSPALLARAAADERSSHGWRRRRLKSTPQQANPHHENNARPSIRILDALKSEASVSTLTGPLATPSMPRLLAQDYYEQQAKPFLGSSYPSEEREHLRYKKTKRQGSNEGFNGCDESPRGVDQFRDPPTSRRMGAKNHSRHVNTSLPQSTSLGDTMASSESLFSGLETRTDLSSVFLEDSDTLTQSFAYTDDDETFTVYEDVSLGSNTFHDTTFTDENTAMSNYSFRMANVQGPKKYQYGVGTPPRFGLMTATRQARNSSKAPSKKSNSSVSRESLDYTITDGSPCCSCLSTVMEEMKGSYKDISKTINQILCAFSVSPDNLDLVSDKIRDARLEVLEMNRRDHRTSPKY
mmetsp:Transcript_12747/g.29297  ORF Transcript_12747/g.29297 Transcript_12747/m.29297 type:complete len:365 (-) Transcript_12747:44-1138(-)